MKTLLISRAKTSGIGSLAIMSTLGLAASTLPSGASPNLITVTCSSQVTEECDQYGTIPAGPWSTQAIVSLVAPKTHCSKVIYKLEYAHPFGRGITARLGLTTLATTRELAPGEGQAFTITAPLTPLRVYAVGVPGGCNKDHVESWGVYYFVGAP